MTIETHQKRQIVDITNEITKQLVGSSGLVNVFIKHTTAAVTTADLDSGTDEDFLDFLAAITPDLKWRHPHDPSHAPDHFLASSIGPEVTIPFKNGKPQLGAWQRIILVELDGPRKREIEISFINAKSTAS